MFMAGPAQQMPTAKETSRESGSNKAEFTGQSDKQQCIWTDIQMYSQTSWDYRAQQISEITTTGPEKNQNISYNSVSVLPVPESHSKEIHAWYGYGILGKTNPWLHRISFEKKLKTGLQSGPVSMALQLGLPVLYIPEVTLQPEDSSLPLSRSHPCHRILLKSFYYLLLLISCCLIYKLNSRNV